MNTKKDVKESLSTIILEVKLTVFRIFLPMMHLRNHLCLVQMNNEIFILL